MNQTKHLPGGAAPNRSESMELFGGSFVDGAVTAGPSVPLFDPVGLPNDSRKGVNFFLRPRFLFCGLNRFSGGCPSSEGSRSLVFCTASTVVGMMGSWACVMPSKLLPGG